MTRRADPDATYAPAAGFTKLRRGAAGTVLNGCLAWALLQGLAPCGWAGDPPPHRHGTIEAPVVDSPPTREILVSLQPGTPPVSFAENHGLTLSHTLRSNPDAHIFIAASPTEAEQLLPVLAMEPQVRSAWLNRQATHVRYTAGARLPADRPAARSRPTSERRARSLALRRVLRKGTLHGRRRRRDGGATPGPPGPAADDP